MASVRCNPYRLKENDRFINCYSMIPWNLTFRYFDEASQTDTVLVAKTGTAEYDAHWRPMLTDFARHLKQKGWFEKRTTGQSPAATKCSAYV